MVTAATLLLKQDAQVHDWAFKGTSLGGQARLSSWLFSLLRCKMSLILPKRLYGITTSFNNITVIADGGVKKLHVATTVAHIWFDNSITQRLQVNFINVTLIEAELMAICLGLIPAIEKENIYDIIVITDSIAVARKIFKSKVNPLQNMFIPVTSAVDFFFRKDSRNKIQFWFCPNKAKWPKHQLVDN